MPEDMRLRERKKLRTRRALVASATRLFEEKGFPNTTVAEIAADAEVSTKTFFNYFPSKEDVLFADADQRMELALALIDNRRPGESLADILGRMVDEVLARIASEDMDVGLGDAKARWRLIHSEPALQARMLTLLSEGQHTLAVHIAAAFPEKCDVITAAAVVGAVLGAAQAVIYASLRRGDPIETALAHGREEMLRTAEALGV